MLAGCVRMKAGMRHVQPRERFCNQEVRMEIQRYLQALASYPDRFARDPDISFEEHLYNLVASNRTSPRRRN
jgi:hypothetical protein